MTQKQHATVPPATVAIRGLAKRFGGVFALRGVDLEIRHGEIHGLLGENGSGKSTLIKVLAGFHRPDAGELAVRGEPVPLPLAPGQFRSLGFDFVHQDLALVPALTVVENLRMAEIASPRHPFHISWRSARRQAKALFERYEFDCDPAAKVEELRPVERALLAIVRAVEGIHVNVADHGGSGLLVLDEPTALLPKAGAEQLFSLVRNVASQGCSVLLVSHHLEEILEVTDRVTVLRDGSVVGTRATPEVTGDELVELIIGRKLAASGGQARRVANRSVVASVRGVRGELVNSVDLAVSEGEVLGLTGLVGSGFEELPYLIFGAWRAEAGELSLDGATWSLPAMTPQKAIDAKIALVPADRQHDGSLPSLPVTDNMTMMMLGRLFRGGLLRRREMERETHTLMEGFDVRPLDPTAVYSAFSGGNQQKALLAKWFHTHPRILMLHEPTQGVDVGAREQIFGLIRSAAAQGLAVICASADYEQLAAICNRVVVISRGRVLSELTGDEVATDRIAERCYTSMPMPISRDGSQASLDGGRTPAFRSS